MAKKCLLAAMLLSIFFPLMAEKITIGLPEPERRPFFFYDKVKGFQGIYVNLLNRIGTIAGFSIEYKLVPQMRLIKLFNVGEIDIEPGIAPAWRSSAEENAISVYSSTFMTMNDVLITPKGKMVTGISSLKDTAKLNGLRVGQVRGFYVPPGLKVEECTSEFIIARQVNLGALDVGFMNDYVARWYQVQNGLVYDISAPIASTQVAFRLHINAKKWLEPINRALKQLQESGELKSIISNIN